MNHLLKSIAAMKVILFTLFYMSIQAAFSQVHNDEQLIRQARQTSNEAIIRKDVEVITSFWLDDYVVIRGSGAVVAGKENNKADWNAIFKETPNTYFERISSEIVISKSNPYLAWENGIWKGFNTYSKGGRYSAQWKKVDGAWKLQAELFVALEK
jgi:ketosteroid isomerase-like protein